MELFAPSLGLIIWTFVNLVSLGLIAYTIYRLGSNDSISSSEKVRWAIVILFVPILGAVLYLRAMNKKSAKATL